eukprot:jgi/Chrpa1/6385/Chrysochromulina_OHIO_Genome00015395-RA
MPAASPEPFPLYSNKALQTTECLYYTFDSINQDAFVQGLTPHYPIKCDVLPPQNIEEAQIFDGYWWTRWTSEHWEVALVAGAFYLVMIVGLKSYMAKREKFRLQNWVICWNFFLSIFSLAGCIACWPKFLVGSDAGLLSRGWYPSVCAHATSYGYGYSGLFVCLFIYSKLAELVDTFFLLVRKSPVILLHWYHHLSVLLYCWHAYSARIGTGLWFASMNYGVHSIMYFYFGLTQTGERGRKFAKKFAMLITTLQLTQMVFGIAVTVSSVIYHAQGRVCYVSLVNSGFGLAMYVSYFFLFLQLFLENYVFNKKGGKPVKAKAESDTLASAADATIKGRVESIPKSDLKAK